MNPVSTPNDSTSQHSLWKFSFIALILICLLSSLSLAADDETPKAIRRASPTMADSAARKVALVIGNKDYKDAPLRNPVNDAEDISNVLKGLGFAVQIKTNVNHRQMDEAVKEFVQKIQNGDVALFYFSGHGTQVKGENYLLPVGGSIESESDVYYDAVSVGRILAKLEESRNKINIVILDACRNNPFRGFRSPSKGLSPMDAPVGTFIAYATAPGSVAADGTDRNSPYAKHLMQGLNLKGVPIEKVFKQVLREVRKETEGNQVPWIASSLQDDFYFNPSHEVSLPVTEPARMTAFPGSDPPDYKAQLEKEKQESEQEIAKLREARRVAAFERERIERERQEMLRERERVASLPAVAPPKPTPTPISGVSSDYGARAERLVGLATTRGDTSSSSELNSIYKDPKAVEWFRQAGEQGDAVAQLMLGRMFHWGLEVPKDGREALKWYRKAADQGNSTAQKNLGLMYEEGFGVPKDGREALKWYRKAADQGNAMAQDNLGVMSLQRLRGRQGLFRGGEVV